MKRPTPPRRRTRWFRTRELVGGVCCVWCAVAALAGLDARLVDSARLAERVAAWSDAAAPVEVRAIGHAVSGRDLLAVRFPRDGEQPVRFRVLFIGVQHGNEHAGKEAIVALLDDLTAGVLAPAPGVELWAVPMINPDGTDADQRRNGHDVDLNRDHVVLSQPETRALHALVAEVRPHVIVDCHEFTRDSRDYRDAGFGEWPLIMMDGVNTPLLPDALMRAGLAWVDAAQPAMDAAGFNYRRYTVGGPPPVEELRFSTLDADDARNGLSFYGGVGFIIESGVMRSADDPQADLPRRVAAYRALLEPFLLNVQLQDQTLRALAAAAAATPPASIPVNAFWATTDNREATYPVLDAAGQRLDVPAYNLMTRRVIKKRVPMPRGYAVDAAHADAYAALLDAHAVPYERLAEPGKLTAAATKLERIEDAYDVVYERYAGRQIVTAEPAAAYELPVGSLLVALDALTPEEARRAVKVLEPRQLFGLYQWDAWRATVGDDGRLPVWLVE